MYAPLESQALSALGEAVRRQRLALRLSQEELAEIAELHRTYVADVERGSRNIGFINLLRLAEALETPLPHLVEGIALQKGKSGGKSPKGPSGRKPGKGR